MNKKVLVLAILIIILGFIIGLFGFNINKNKEIKLAKENFSEVKDGCIDELKRYEESIKETTYAEEKVSPNTIMVFKILYTKCNHAVENKCDVNNNLVNLTKEELQEVYKEWTIEKFTNDEIILSKEEGDFCNQHYVLRNKKGYVNVYKLDENGEEVLINKTDIAIKFLSKEDDEKLKDGIKVYSRVELNKILEDFGY